MPNGHDVAILDHVFLAFETKQSFFLKREHRSVFYEVVVMADFGPNEMIREICMNYAGGILRIGAACDCPCATLFFTHSEEGNQSQQPVCRTDEAFCTGFRQPIV